MLLAALATPLAAQPSMRSATFKIFIRGADAGSEEVTVMQSAEGWILRGSGRLGPPLDLTVKFWEIRYDSAWRPRELTFDLAAKLDARTVHTTFAGTSAVSEIAQGPQATKRVDTVAADTVVLPNLVFGAYEALAARLATAAPGAELRAFIAPQGEIAARAVRVSDETIQVSNRTMAARRWLVTFMNPGAPLDVDVWTEAGHLLRVDIPAQMVSVVREDVATVAARVVTIARPNDEQATIPANGFNLAATVSKPSGSAAARLPAVILVSGSGLADRDETIANIPVFGQLAGGLADAGFLVVRYDKRGVGQSGGRLDVVSLADFTEDARAVARWAARRKDVDPKRVALVGYGEGGWIALQAASQDDRVAALILVAAASVSGSELVLEQQRSILARSTMPPADKERAVEQQKKIMQAVVSGTGWEAVSADVRRRVDTPWYQSFLLFDPARVLSKTRQPVLVVQGDLDREIPPHHGEQLAQLARSRPKGRGADLARLPAVNHLLARATTGETDEYSRLPDRAVDAQALLEITTWLQRTFAPPAPRK
jgi:uncharacterized protein